MQLFSKKSIYKLLEVSGFEDITVKSFNNRYALKYWIRLLPIPDLIKKILTKTLRILNLDQLKISINVGNLIAYGSKPQRTS